jgi:hypothetical protein
MYCKSLVHLFVCPSSVCCCSAVLGNGVRKSLQYAGRSHESSAEHPPRSSRFFPTPRWSKTGPYASGRSLPVASRRNLQMPLLYSSSILFCFKHSTCSRTVVVHFMHHRWKNSPSQRLQVIYPSSQYHHGTYCIFVFSPYRTHFLIVSPVRAPPGTV